MQGLFVLLAAAELATPAIVVLCLVVFPMYVAAGVAGIVVALNFAAEEGESLVVTGRFTSQRRQVSLYLATCLRGGRAWVQKSRTMTCSTYSTQWLAIWRHLIAAGKCKSGPVT